jgi:hypothetical protein
MRVTLHSCSKPPLNSRDFTRTAFAPPRRCLNLYTLRLADHKAGGRARDRYCMLKDTHGLWNGR